MQDIFFSAGVVIVAAVLLFLISAKERARKQWFKQYLIDHKWYPEAENIANYIATSLLGVGFYQEIIDGFAGLHHGRPMHTVMYQYKVQRGNSVKTHTFISCCIELNLLVPFILLDSTANNFLGQSNLPEPIPGSRTLQLEGNFNKTYHVVVMPGTERTVLELMTPDFMHELLSAPPNVDIELEGDQLFLIMKDATFSKPVLDELFGAADVVMKHLSEVKFSWQATASRDTLMEMTTQALSPRATVLSRPARYR